MSVAGTESMYAVTEMELLQDKGTEVCLGQNCVPLHDRDGH